MEGKNEDVPNEESFQSAFSRQHWVGDDLEVRKGASQEIRKATQGNKAAEGQKGAFKPDFMLLAVRSSLHVPGLQ